MSQHYERNAEAVVKGFLDLLDAEARKCISQAQRDELSMMIELAISTAVLEQLEAVADEVADISILIRRRAERYDQGNQAA